MLVLSIDKYKPHSIKVGTQKIDKTKTKNGNLLNHLNFHLTFIHFPVDCSGSLPLLCPDSPLSAAFNTVNHSIFLSSLAATGICDTALDWIKSYLSGRSS